jgi:hypothetical protein
MSPEEVHKITESAGFSWDGVPWVLYLVSFFLSLLGAFLGAYVKRKGEHLATKEDFEDLLTQVRKTTQATEQIKVTLSSNVWFSQQQWVIREKHYVDLLRHLWLLKNAMRDQDMYFREPGSEHNESYISKQPHFIALTERADKAYQTIRELMGPAAIFLSKETMGALGRLVSGHEAVAEQSMCTAEYVSEASNLAQVAYDAVLAEAKNELEPKEPRAA